MAAKLECAHVDTCLPDYWSGHHLPHVQIAVWRGMTMRQVKQAIRDELRQGAVMGSTDYARLLSADMVAPGEEKRAGWKAEGVSIHWEGAPECCDHCGAETESAYGEDE